MECGSRLIKNDRGEGLAMVEIGNRDMRIYRFKTTLYSIQFSAGPEKIRPEDGLPASDYNERFLLHRSWGHLTLEIYYK